MALAAAPSAWRLLLTAALALLLPAPLASGRVGLLPALAPVSQHLLPVEDQPAERDAEELLQKAAVHAHEPLTGKTYRHNEGLTQTANTAIAADAMREKLANVEDDETSSVSGTMSGLFSSSSIDKLLHFAQWHGDVFGDVTKSLDRQGMFHTSRQWLDWMYLGGAVVMMILLDTFVLRRFTKDCTWRTHVVILMFWIAVALAFAIFIDVTHGREMSLQWMSGYLLEWLLSMDNLFVFHLIFSSFATPEAQLHKALFFGIIGAVVFRMAFFVVLHALLNLHKWIHYLFGLILIYSGVQAAISDDEEEDPSKSALVRVLKRCMGDRLYGDYSSTGSLTITKGVGENQKLCVTLLVPVVILLEVWDIVFAVDSVSAKVAQIPDQFMNYSSSVFAMFGLRAMFFIIHDLVQYFELLKYGLCFILVFIGMELMFESYVQLPASTVMILILTVFAVCCTGSALKQVVERKKGDDEGSDVPVPHTDHA